MGKKRRGGEQLDKKRRLCEKNNRAEKGREQRHEAKGRADKGSEVK